ncbi:prepilin-type N-terminal cleavage/methylation domain-containing protein [Deinococcus sp. VB343]|uniref:Prepilin-type N-terminal cleavage/methylation domain-containing protein n=1 Tax=Deinococcus sp. VB142 TaxID=3112952 RepID=A0AAU6Q3C3_9DEIO
MKPAVRPPAQRQGGFTLIEILVALALLGVVLGLLVSFFTQSTRTSSQVSTRAEMQEDILITQQIIASRLREAWAVLPPGTIVDFGSGALRRNPAAGNINGSWEIGAHPLLALILPPDAPQLSCTATIRDGCYRFFAYYPVKRSTWVSGTSSTSTRNPGPDPDNGDTWVLAEYTLYYDTPPELLKLKEGLTTLDYSKSQVNLLADYVAPGIPTGTFTTAANAYTMFSYSVVNEEVSGVTMPVVKGVTLRLATARQQRGQLMRLPDATGTYTITVFPKNLGKVAVQ